MSAFSRICLIGFGEVGQILADDLAKAGVKHISAYDILFGKPGSIPSRAAAKRDIRVAPNASAAARGSELIVSAVTAASDLAAAQSIVPGLARGTFYADLNSASPGMKKKVAEIVEQAGSRYVEVAVMTPIAPKRIASRMLLGGPHAEEFLARATPLGFEAEVFSHDIGKASATKMCRSVIIKGIEALLMEAMLAARHYGVEKTVLDSLSDLLPIGDWEKLAHYMISRSLEHGVRRAEEMREAANTVSEAGIAPLMSLAAAEHQGWAAERKSALANEKLGALLDSVLKNIDGKRA